MQGYKFWWPLTLFVAWFRIVSSISVEDRLAALDVSEKIGQMVQIDISKFLIGDTANVDYALLEEWIVHYKIGSILNSPFSGQGKLYGWNATEWRTLIVGIQAAVQNTKAKIPVIYGIDSIHGATYTKDAALFPQALATAASFDRSHAYNCGKTASKDTRASGIPWMFAPVLGLGLHPLWARFSETFGEDMYLAAEMGVATIKGMQDVVPDGGIPSRAAACMKHFIAYSMPWNGHDRSPVNLPDRLLRQLYVPSFKAAVDAGVMTAMESYNEVGGVPMASSSDYLTTLLRQEMNFTGFLVTDYQEIENLHNWHRVADSQSHAVQMAMEDTTIDMSMVPTDPSFNNLLAQLVESGVIPESRLDESVLRILRVKEALGMFDETIVVEDVNVVTVGQAADWDLSLDAARGAIALVQNNDASLPLSDPATKIFVSGPTCDSLAAQAGGWSIHWQGAVADTEFSNGVTIRRGLEALFPASVTYLPGPAMDATNIDDLNTGLWHTAVDSADAVVLCVGEGTYAEKPGDIDDLALPAGQVEYVTAIRDHAGTTKNIILVIVSQRPRLLHEAVVASSSVLNAFAPGPMGGQAIAEIIAGAVIPSGRMPYTYPRNAGDIPYAYHHHPGDQCVNANDGYIDCEVEWPFGHGLSYVPFTYSDLTLSSNEVSEDGTLDVSVTVTNSGPSTAQHSVLLFLFDMYRRVAPEYKLLKRFDKVNMTAGASQTLKWTLTSADMQYVGIDSRYVLESGLYYVGIGSDVDCRSTNQLKWKSINGDEVMCAPYNLTLSSTYNAVCEYGCALWAGGLCGVTVDTVTCNSKCNAESWSWNYVNCLQQYEQGEFFFPRCYEKIL